MSGLRRSTKMLRLINDRGMWKRKGRKEGENKKGKKEIEKNKRNKREEEKKDEKIDKGKDMKKVSIEKKEE